MTDAYLLPIGTAALLFPALAFVMFVPTAIVLYRRHGVMTRWRVLSLYGGVYYALTAFCMVIVPLPKPSVDVCKKYPSFAEPQFTPGVAVSDIWKEAHHRVTLDALILHNSAFWQTVFNLILLLPLGMLVRVHFRRGLAAATAVGFAASLLFELTQYSGLWASTSALTASSPSTTSSPTRREPHWGGRSPGRWHGCCPPWTPWTTAHWPPARSPSAVAWSRWWWMWQASSC